jgi:hypothetical protein
MHRLIAIVGLALLASACTPGSQDTTVTTTTAPAVTTTRAPSNEVCLAGDMPFAAEGLIAALGEDFGDAASLAEVRWDRSASCERITLAFDANSGAPAATLGPTGVSVIPYAGVVRILLPPEVNTTVLADNLLEGELIHAVYVFRDDDQLSIDLHAADGVPITARAFTTTSPASLIVDVARAQTEAVPVGVTTTRTVVAISPTPGTGSYPILVEGYVLPAAGSVHVQLLEEGITLDDETLILGGAKDAWQWFSSTIDEGPVGSVVVFIGSVDDDGIAEVGARVSVTVE